MMAGGYASATVRQLDADILHHALILMIEDVAVQDEVADIAPIAAAQDKVRLLPAMNNVSFQTPFSRAYCEVLPGSKPLTS